MIGQVQRFAGSGAGEKVAGEQGKLRISVCPWFSAIIVLPPRPDQRLKDGVSLRTITRVAELRRVFRGGQSDLLNAVARLAILYEDLRLEMREFQKSHTAVIELGEEDTENRVPYFLRRALETLVEFGSGLNTLRAMPEFKSASSSLTELDSKCISDADRFIQQNWARIKELRNGFAGHIHADAVAFAVKRLTNEVGKVTWNPDSSGWTIGIECDFAGVLLAGVISSKFQSGVDVVLELRKALEVLSQGFNHVQAAMLALVHAFLWERFGG